MNILITGATGFIGKALIHELARSSHNIFGLDSRDDKQEVGNLPLKKYIDQDLTVPFRLDVPFDHVCHLGALNVTHVGKAGYQEYHSVNVRGTENLIKAVNTRNFVFMSTVKVYRQQEGILDEDSPVGPEGDYEQSKLEAEELCRRHFNDENLTIFRAVNVVGPGQAQKAVMPVFFKQAINNEPLEIIYSIHTPLQLLYVGDLVRAFVLLLEKDRGVGVVNLCPEETVTLGRLAEEVIAISRSSSAVHLCSDEQVLLTKVISKRAQAALGWKAQTTVQEILKKYYEFMSVHT